MTIRLQPYHSLAVTRPKARARLQRRVRAMLDYLKAHPESTSWNDPLLHRLDDLVGEAESLCWRLP